MTKSGVQQACLLKKHSYCRRLNPATNLFSELCQIAVQFCISFTLTLCPCKNYCGFIKEVLLLGLFCWFFLNPEYGEDIVEAIIQANILPKWYRRCWSSAHSEVILSCRVGWGFCVCVCIHARI